MLDEEVGVLVVRGEVVQDGERPWNGQKVDVREEHSKRLDRSVEPQLIRAAAVSILRLGSYNSRHTAHLKKAQRLTHLRFLKVEFRAC